MVAKWTYTSFERDKELNAFESLKIDDWGSSARESCNYANCRCQWWAWNWRCHGNSRGSSFHLHTAILIATSTYHWSRKNKIKLHNLLCTCATQRPHWTLRKWMQDSLRGTYAPTTQRWCDNSQPTHSLARSRQANWSREDRSDP